MFIQIKQPGDIKSSDAVTLKVTHSNLYTGKIKLLERAKTVFERVLERRIRQMEIHSNKFGFMPRKSTIGAIFILRQEHEKILQKILNFRRLGKGLRSRTAKIVATTSSGHSDEVNRRS